MKSLRQLPIRFIRRFWLVSGVIGLMLVLGGIMLARPHSQFHEGGLLQSQMSSKPAAKLPDVAAVPVQTVQSLAAHNCAENDAGKLLLISISQQHMWACDGTSLANETAVTTGASGLTNVDDATPIGTWHIYGKHTDTHLRGSDANGAWDDYVQYWMPFDGEVGFHDASWQTFPFGGSQYTTEGSHGCVHLPTAIAAWVYGWAPIGTTVTVES